MNHQTMKVNEEFRRHVQPQSVPSGQGTLGAAIRHYADMQPGRPAVISSGFAPLSYLELHHLINEVRAALRSAGLGRSARVAVAMPNGPVAALAIVAVSCSTVCIPLNPRQTLREIEKCLAAVRPDAVLVMKGDESAARQAAAAGGMTIIETVQSKAGVLGLDIAALSTAAASSCEPDEPDPDAPAFILQTSGTTADSKLIPTSHRNMLAAAARVQAWFNLTPQDRCLSVSPVFYAHGLHVTVFVVLLSGGTIAFPSDASKLDCAEWFEALKPTWYSAGPTLHRLVLDQFKSELGAKIDHALRFIVSGGAPLPLDVQDDLRRLFDVPVLEHYGSSEGMQICANQLPPGRSKPGTCGVPWPDTIKIVGDDGRELPQGELGEILIGGPTVVSGYLDAPELTCVSFLNGWFKSGDVGSVDQEGFLTLHGRKDDLINRGGEKISPLEIDEALTQHPAVAEAAAFAVPHARLGQDVAAAVVLYPGMKVSPIELRRYLRSHVAAFKVPRRIMICDQLPKGATGKVLRRLLTKSFQDEPVAANELTVPEKADGKFVELVVRLTVIWERLLKIAPLSLDDDFFEKGGDSLLAVDMLAELDDLTGEVIPASVLLDAPTIRQLAQVLSERSNSGPKNLVAINGDGQEPPLVLFHGDYIWGGGHLTLGLTKLLGVDRPVFVVVPHGGSEAFPQSVEAMAADRLPLILQAQPEGPYRLCGYCLGGIVAFETARLLLAAGKEVEMVFMINSPTINARKSTRLLLSLIKQARPVLGAVVDRAMAWTWYQAADLQKFCNVSWTRKRTAIKTKVQKSVSAVGGQNIDSSANVGFSGLANLGDARTAKYAAAMSYYSPKPLAVRVIYVAVDYGSGKWGRISQNIEVVKSPGSHYYLDIPHIAGVLSTHLYAKK